MLHEAPKAFSPFISSMGMREIIWRIVESFFKYLIKKGTIQAGALPGLY